MRELIAAILKANPPYPLTKEVERIKDERELLAYEPTEADCAFEWPQDAQERRREKKRKTRTVPTVEPGSTQARVPEPVTIPLVRKRPIRNMASMCKSCIRLFHECKCHG